MLDNDRVNDVASKRDSANGTPRVCETCKWRSDDFTSVCVNDESDNLADFVGADDTCDKWEAKCDIDEWNDLLPCPFCGGNPALKKLYALNKVVQACAECVDCGASIYKETCDGVAMAWNMRRHKGE